MATDRSNADPSNPDRSNPDRSNAGRSETSPEKRSGEAASMKERLLAQRCAEAEAATRPAAAAPPVPAARPPASNATARAQAAAAAARATPASVPAAAPVAEARSSSSAASRRPVQLAGARQEERAARRERKGASPEVMKEVELLRKEQDKWIMYGWMVAGGLLLIAGITYFVVKGKHDRALAELKAKNDAILAFVEKEKHYDLHTEAGINSLMADTDDPANADFWNTEIGGAHTIVSGLRGTAVREREHIKQVQELQNGVADLEAICGNASSRSADELAKARRRFSEYENAGADLDEALKKRVERAHACIDKAYVSKLHEEAKATAAKGPAEARNALTAFTKAEDEITRSLDEAMKYHKPQETVEFYQKELQTIVPESDEVVKQVFTPDVIDKTPWTDFLSDAYKTNWQNAAFKGWQIKDGVLQGVGPDLDAKNIAIMSVNDQQPMRDYLFECEFTLVKGDATFLFRLGASANNAVSEMMSTTGKDPLKAGTSNAMTVSLIGSAFKMTFADGEHNFEEPELRWTYRRKGGIGISVPPGSEIRITKMRAKILR